VGGDVDLTMELPPAPASASAAREALAPLGERLPEELLESIRLLVTELITNSVKHGRIDERQVRVNVTLTPEVLRVEVTDGGNGFEPPPPPADPSDTPSGWGLYLVDRLADRWGVEEEDGTLVWFEIDRV
jgi:anti-sigma regulatory factor (Ser/Thr protein kinase)